MYNFTVYRTEGDPITVQRDGNRVDIGVGFIGNHLTLSIEADTAHELIHKLQQCVGSEIERIKMELYLEDRDDKRKQSD